MFILREIQEDQNGKVVHCGNQIIGPKYRIVSCEDNESDFKNIHDNLYASEEGKALPHGKNYFNWGFVMADGLIKAIMYHHHVYYFMTDSGKTFEKVDTRY